MHTVLKEEAKFIKKICYIIGAGEADDIFVQKKDGDFIIAADGGYMYLEKYNIKPDLLVGDFDSLNYVPQDIETVRHAPEKDDTDMLLAVKEGIIRGYKTFVIYGGLGGRLDHTYANLQVLSYLSNENAFGYLLGGGKVITAIKDGRLCFSADKKGVVSVFCVGDNAEGVYLKGLKYELDNVTLSCSIPVGVSNEFLGKESTVEVNNGILLVMWSEKAEEVIDNL